MSLIHMPTPTVCRKAGGILGEIKPASFSSLSNRFISFYKELSL